MNVLNKQSKEPYYIQISNALESMIRSSYFAHGQKLPTLLEMKNIFNVSLKVAGQAYEDLSKKGLIYSQRGKGYFVSYYKSMEVSIEDFHQLEARLIHEEGFKRHVILFEVINTDAYVAKQLKIDEDTKCYHIKQFFGKDHQNVLYQEIYLPANQFPKLNKEYGQYQTTLSLIMNGYRHTLDEFSNKFFSSQATIEHELFLRLKYGEPLWRIESIFLNDKEQPLALINQYLSGEFITMAVMVHVD